jgi:hypothetical protein
LAKHRVAGSSVGGSAGDERLGKPPSFGSVLVLAVLGAIASAVIIHTLGTGDQRATADSAPSVVGVLAGSSRSPSPSAMAPSPSLVPALVSSTGPRAIPTATVTRSPRSAPATKPTSVAPVNPAPPVVAASYAVKWEGNGGFIASVDVQNKGSQATGWTVELTFTADVNVQLQGRDASVTVERVGNMYRFRGTVLQPVQKTQFAFFASRRDGSSQPSRCVVNGRTCQ